MKVIHDARELKPVPPGGVCAAIGVFDGVHLGHQRIIRQTLEHARSQEALAVIITFDRHPSRVVAPQNAPPLIQTLPQKLEVMGTLGVDATLLIHFDESFSRRPGEDFVRALARDFGGLRGICVGEDFHFGHRRSGNIHLLRELGRELEFEVRGIKPVVQANRPISSTRIREAIRNGDLEAAASMLGRQPALAGPIVRGDQLGRTLGFPTANLDTDGLVLPPNGVYAVRARYDDDAHLAVLNIGLRPTLNSKAPVLRVEAHLLNYAGNLYGKELELILEKKLRDEVKFPSLDALKRQITQDILTAQEHFQTKQGK